MIIYILQRKFLESTRHLLFQRIPQNARTNINVHVNSTRQSLFGQQKLGRKKEREEFGAMQTERLWVKTLLRGNSKEDQSITQHARTDPIRRKYSWLARWAKTRLRAQPLSFVVQQGLVGPVNRIRNDNNVSRVKRPSKIRGFSSRG